MNPIYIHIYIYVYIYICNDCSKGHNRIIPVWNPMFVLNMDLLSIRLTVAHLKTQGMELHFRTSAAPETYTGP